MLNIPEHDAAALLPAMSETEFSALVADIRENGLREPIVLHEGKVLDGRHRLRACEQLGIEPQIKQWDGKGSPEAFVTSMNLHRRHLNASQRALIAARMANLQKGQRADLAAKNQDDQKRSSAPLGQATAAKLMNVPRSTVIAAKKVLTEGTAEEVGAIERGEAAASTIANQIATGLTPEERAKYRQTPAKSKGNNPNRLQTLKIRGRIFTQVREALIALSTLPLPAEVVPVVRAQDRGKAVNEQLTRALKWLMEFSDEWNRQGAAPEIKAEGAGDHHSDPRSGNGPAGAEWPKSAA